LEIQFSRQILFPSRYICDDTGATLLELFHAGIIAAWLYRVLARQPQSKPRLS
jgi:hypothetical protein